MRTPSTKFRNPPPSQSADTPSTPQRGFAPHEAVVAGTFKSLGFAASGVVERARQNAQLALKGKTKTQERPMSVDRCANCAAVVDTDKDGDCYVPILEGKRLETVECLCEPCRDRLIEQKEIADAAACLHEEKSAS